MASKEFLVVFLLILHGALTKVHGANIIDRCWRCRADWATDRKRLAQCARGFGHKTVAARPGSCTW